MSAVAELTLRFIALGSIWDNAYPTGGRNTVIPFGTGGVLDRSMVGSDGFIAVPQRISLAAAGTVTHDLTALAMPDGLDSITPINLARLHGIVVVLNTAGSTASLTIAEGGTNPFIALFGSGGSYTLNGGNSVYCAMKGEDSAGDATSGTVKNILYTAGAGAAVTGYVVYIGKLS